MATLNPTDLPQYRQQRGKAWSELERLLDRASGASLRSLSMEEVRRLGMLYRALVNHLAQARAFGGDPALEKYLNDLAVRAHALLYAPKRRSPLKAVAEFWAFTWPQTVRRCKSWHFWAAFILLSSSFFGYAVTEADPETAFMLIPDAMYPAAAVEELIVSGQSRNALVTYGREMSPAMKGQFGAMLFTHNLQVGIAVFAVGIALSVPSILLQLYNGLTLGSFSALFNRDGIDWRYWGWLLPHGITELWAIIICGAAGMMLGFSLIRPGALGRRESLKQAARTAAMLMLGTIPMFILAGVVESFLRQSHLPTRERLLFAGLTFFLWGAYFVYAGRDDSENGGNQ